MHGYTHECTITHTHTHTHTHRGQRRGADADAAISDHFDEVPTKQIWKKYYRHSRKNCCALAYEIGHVQKLFRKQKIVPQAKDCSATIFRELVIDCCALAHEIGHVYSPRLQNISNFDF